MKPQNQETTQQENKQNQKPALKRRAFKKVITTLSLLFFTLLFMSNTELSGGAASPRTGSPGDGSTCTACHSGSQAIAMDSVISSNIPANGYTPETFYTITATINRSGHNCFGFELSPQDVSGNLLGKLVNTSNETKLILSDKYITHTSAGTTGNDSKTWTFTWESPAAGTGAVTLYGAFLAANHDGTIAGDSTFLSALTIPENLSTGLKNIETKKMNLLLLTNPVTDRLQFDLQLSQAADVNMNLYDLNGNRVQGFFSGHQVSGNTTYSFHREPTLNAGMYFLKVEQGTNAIVQKLVLN